MSKLSIIIPTMLKNITILNKELEDLVNEPSVGEIIVIDNSLQGFKYNSDKVKVIIPNKNLYVNASWNLGVESSLNEYIGILNDDLLLPKNFCSEMLNFMTNTPDVGVIGLDTPSILNASINQNSIYADNFKYTKIENVLYLGFWGSAIFCDKSNYYKIPQNIKIWCGDNFLVKNNIDNNKLVYKVSCDGIFHLGALTSGSANLRNIKQKDIYLYAKIDPQFKKHDWYVYYGKFSFIVRLYKFLKARFLEYYNNNAEV